MKIDSEKVDELIKIFKSYLEGIIETVQIGDDGFKDSCIYQKNVAMNEILNWRAINIPKPVEKTKPEKELEEMKPHERWGHNLKSYLMRKIPADESIGEIDSNGLFSHIELYLDSPEAKSMQEAFYNIYPATGIQVVQEIVDKIKEERQKAPQTKLF